MQIDAFLCNHAEAVNNMLYIAGGGIEQAMIAPGAAPPYTVTVGIAIMVTVPWGQTNQQHRVEIELLGEDGESVQLPTGPDSTEPLQMLLTFNVGRGPLLAVGDDQHVCLAANIPLLPMPAFGKYEFVVRLDGHDERRLPMRVVPTPGAQMAFNPGSASRA
ncbi:MAG: DUF6941 family protein [Pseudonocardiaceae bacterium]